MPKSYILSSCGMLFERKFFTVSIDPKIIASKTATRRKLADLPVAEKLRLLDAMRKDAILLRESKPWVRNESREGQGNSK